MTLLLPPGVETCLDARRALCSANAYLDPPPPRSRRPDRRGHIAAGTYRVALTYQTRQRRVSAQLDAGGHDHDGPPRRSRSSRLRPPPGATGWNAYVTAANGMTLHAPGGHELDRHRPHADLAERAAPRRPSRRSAPTTPRSTSAAPRSPTSCSRGRPARAATSPMLPRSRLPRRRSSCRSASGSASSARSASRRSRPSSTRPSTVGRRTTARRSTTTTPACPAADGLDTATVGSSSQNPYYLQREFNNAAVLEFEPWTYFGCAPLVNLDANFVAPSAVNQGDEVQFDGSATASTLIVPSGGYVWNFGDGTAWLIGPSVVHTFAKAGTYTVTLDGHRPRRQPAELQPGRDRADHQRPAALRRPSTGGRRHRWHGRLGGTASSRWPCTCSCCPQSLRSVLTWGLRLRVNSNQPANGLVTVSISRQAATAGAHRRRPRRHRRDRPRHRLAGPQRHDHAAARALAQDGAAAALACAT